MQLGNANAVKTALAMAAATGWSLDPTGRSGVVWIDARTGGNTARFTTRLPCGALWVANDVPVGDVTEELDNVGVPAGTLGRVAKLVDRFARLRGEVRVTDTHLVVDEQAGIPLLEVDAYPAPQPTTITGGSAVSVVNVPLDAFQGTFRRAAAAVKTERAGYDVAKAVVIRVDQAADLAVRTASTDSFTLFVEDIPGTVALTSDEKVEVAVPRELDAYLGHVAQQDMDDLSAELLVDDPEEPTRVGIVANNHLIETPVVAGIPVQRILGLAEATVTELEAPDQGISNTREEWRDLVSAVAAAGDNVVVHFDGSEGRLIAVGGVGKVRAGGQIMQPRFPSTHPRAEAETPVKTVDAALAAVGDKPAVYITDEVDGSTDGEELSLRLGHMPGKGHTPTKSSALLVVRRKDAPQRRVMVLTAKPSGPPAQVPA